jgi:hypothetical protein
MLYPGANALLLVDAAVAQNAVASASVASSPTSAFQKIQLRKDGNIGYNFRTYTKYELF